MIRVSVNIFIISYLNTFSDYCKTVLKIIKKKKRVFSFIGANSILLGANSKQPLGADS